MSASSWRKRALALLAVLAALCVAALLLLHGAGDWLVVQDPLEHARAIVVLGGQVPFRAMEAARVYRQGWAPEVWITRTVAHPEDLALARLGIDRPLEYVYSRQVLERLGVPPASIHVLPNASVNTEEDVRAVAQALRAAGGTRVILITSKYHTRRVRIIWHALAGKPLTAIVRYTPDDPFQPGRWWHDTTDAEAVAHEWMGILNAWAGFPMKTQP
jgi:uncharacterized SAM-binding protein YcdF (DUF218 family)